MTAYIYGNCRWCGEPEESHTGQRKRCNSSSDVYGYKKLLWLDEALPATFIELTRCDRCRERPAEGAYLGSQRVCRLCYKTFVYGG